MDPKSFFASKTVWVNIIGIVLAILSLPEFIGVLPVTWLPYIALVTAFLNIVLRTVTTQPIGKS